MTPFLPRRRYVTYRGELGDIAGAALRRRVAEGPNIDAFERALADYHGVAHAHTVNSGRVGLLVLLEALGLEPGDEILVPAYTLRALVVLLEQVGYVPVPVDIDPATYNIDPARVRERIGPATRALLATHLFGRPCAMDRLVPIARDARLLVIEDCAQALGSELGDRKVGSLGDGAILSFDLLKPINTFGGGAVLTDDAEVSGRIAAALARLHRPGAELPRRIALGLAEHTALTTPAARVIAMSLAHPWTRALVERSYRSMQDSVRPTRSRFSNLQAGIGLRLLDSLDGRVAVRRSMARTLARLLGERPALTVGRGDNGYFFVRLAAGDPSELRRALLGAGIDAGIGSEVADFCGDLGRAADCPAARDVHAHAIQLPLHEGLDDRGLERIAAACAGRLRG